jgi:ABC-type transport system substrate-binding protein
LTNADSTKLRGVVARGQLRIVDFAWVGTPLALSNNQDICRTGGVANYGKFSNPTVDVLFQQALGEVDPARAASIDNQIDQQLWCQLPSMPLYQLSGLLAWRQELVNVGHNPALEGPFWNAGAWGSPMRRPTADAPHGVADRSKSG